MLRQSDVKFQFSNALDMLMNLTIDKWFLFDYLCMLETFNLGFFISQISKALLSFHCTWIFIHKTSTYLIEGELFPN